MPAGTAATAAISGTKMKPTAPSRPGEATIPFTASAAAASAPAAPAHRAQAASGRSAILDDMIPQPTPKIFYGWYIVAAGVGLQALQAGLMMQAFGAYVAVLADEQGWSKTALSGGAALQQMEAAILGPILGWLLDRYGPKRFIRVGVVIFGAGLMALSQVQTLIEFYLAFILIALGQSLSGFFPVNVMIIHWFERQRARALSAMSFGLALGGIAVPLVAWSMQTYGWRATAFGSGVLMILAGLPLTLFFFNRPEERGYTVDGLPATPHVTDEASTDAAPGTRDFTAGEALRTKAFWLLSLGHGFALLVVGAVTVHAIVHMKEGLGYTVTEASFMYTVVTVSQILGVLVGWIIGDRYDKRLICAACMLMHCAGLLLLTFALAPWMVVGFALLHGMAWGLRGPFMQAMRADYFGRSSIGMILGLSFLIVVIGQIGGPMIAGIFADLTGNYRTGFTILALTAGLGSVFFLLAQKPPRPSAAP
jgi:sugar phosphate permease